jgi:hypothetical protein
MRRHVIAKQVRYVCIRAAAQGTRKVLGEGVDDVMMFNSCSYFMRGHPPPDFPLLRISAYGAPAHGLVHCLSVRLCCVQEAQAAGQAEEEAKEKEDEHADLGDDDEPAEEAVSRL